MVDDGPCLNKNIFLVFFFKKKDTKKKRKPSPALINLIFMCFVWKIYRSMKSPDLNTVLRSDLQHVSFRACRDSREKAPRVHLAINSQLLDPV